jgi:hypothetical protein
MGTDRLCHTDSDCLPGTPGFTSPLSPTPVPLDKCCTLTRNGLTTNLCLNSTIQQFGGLIGLTVTCGP